MNLTVYGILSLLVAAADIFLGLKVFAIRRKEDNAMGVTLILAANVAIFYFASAATTSYFISSFFSSLEFLSISIMCFHLLIYVVNYTKVKVTGKTHILIASAGLYCIFDTIILLINPFHEIAIHYNFRPGCIAMWQYLPKTLYELHLIYCYILIASVFALLIWRSAKTPRAYRKKYLNIIWGILFILLLNGIFLIFQNQNMLDFSILFYSVICFYLYWSRCYYSSHGMLASVRQLLINELDNLIILFDNENELAMCSKQAEPLIQSIKNKNHTVTLHQFEDAYNFPADLSSDADNIHFQWTYKNSSKVSIYRVDVKRLKDHKNRTIGKLLVFTDTSLEMDLLTGFHSKISFERHFHNYSLSEEYPVGVAICDINNLTHINRVYGKDSGDEVIQSLSQLMMEYFPKNTYFARLDEANLLAVCPASDSNELRNCIAKIRNEMSKRKDFDIPLEIQSAIATADKDNPDIIQAEKTAYFSLKFKKLLDGNSAHSSLLDSFAQTMQESDSTTHEHVERTKKMGELLGVRLGFTDSQLSQLALLCLLHDIGKLGIPLEILNKPGKLNSAEWDVMKSHVEKGYRIAMASDELKDIADLIRHHHESWNGKGYPDGLKQESIPLLSRVISVVDTYDAMTNDRPYHKAVSDKAARDELKRCAGVQFDPTIVAEFLNLLEELHPLKNNPEAAAAEDKNKQLTDAPRGVKEIFSQNQDAAESDFVIPIVYTKYIIDENFKIIQIDDQFTELTGYTQQDVNLYKLSQWDLIPNEDLEAYKKVIFSGDGKLESYIEHRVLRKDSSIRNVICLGKQKFDPVSRKPQTEIIVFDSSITNVVLNIQKNERESAKRSFNKWENLIRRDSLTGILNHESFINDVEMELLKDNQKNVLLLLDVDYFKNYNDSYGHLAGDKLLSLLASVLNQSVKSYGFPGRLGGDEFAALLKFPVDTPEADINTIIDTVFNSIINTTNSMEQNATISMGAATFTEMTNFNKVYQTADKALYRAKEKGRKCWSL